MEDQTKSNRWDKLGIFSSGLCLLHCAIGPILVYGLSLNVVALDWLHNPLIEFSFFAAAIVFFTIAFKDSNSNRINLLFMPWQFWLGIAGFAIMIGGHVLFHHSAALYSILGGAMIISAHFFNLRCRLSLS